MKPYSIPGLAVIGLFMGGLFGISEGAIGGMTAIGIISLIFDFFRSRYPGVYERQWFESQHKDAADRDAVRRDVPPAKSVEVRL